MQRLYEDWAQWFTLLSPPDDYIHEAKLWEAAIRAHLGPGRHRLLEMGVGVGCNLCHFADGYDVTALDLSPHMIREARAILPSARLLVGDMRTVEVDGGPFDVVTCHDAISYMATESDLLAAFSNAHRHLRPGGIYICTPDDVEDSFEDQALHSSRHERDGATLTYCEHVARTGPSTLAVHFFFVLQQRPGAEPEAILERHTFGCFPASTWLRLLETAGFNARRVPYPVHDDGREGWMFVGVKRPS